MMRLTILDNGLKVASRHMPGVETVAIGLHAEAGSRHEPAEHNGIAHLFEHMVFKGAGPRNAREISEAIEDVGGDLNACTDRSGTSFSAALLAEHLPLGVELISNLIVDPHLRAGDLEREKEVVLQELGEARDTPSDIIFDDLWTVSFADQSIGRPVLGDEETIGRIGVEDLVHWRDTRFRAGSLALVAAGKVDHDRLVDLAQARLGALPQGRLDPAEPGRFTGGRRSGRVRADQAHLAMAHGAPGATAPDHHAARLFADLVGGGASSRLFQAVREERGLAYSVWASLSAYPDCGLFYLYAATAPRAAAAAASLVEEVVAQAAIDASPRELERVRTQARAGLLMSLETSWGQSAYVARSLAIHGRLVEPADAISELEAVTLDELRAAGAAMLAGPRANATIGFPAARAA